LSKIQKAHTRLVSLTPHMSLAQFHEGSRPGFGYVSKSSIVATWSYTTTRYELSICHARSLTLHNIWWLMPNPLGSRSLALCCEFT